VAGVSARDVLVFEDMLAGHARSDPCYIDHVEPTAGRRALRDGKLNPIVWGRDDIHGEAANGS
jgi:hypothetical protein